jgi:hypothetical protein
MTRLNIVGLSAVCLLLALQEGVLADVLILRDGRRVDGVLTGVSGNTIEFEHRGGREDGRVRRYDRDEVRSIQFDDNGRQNDSPGSRFQESSRGRSALRERAVTVDARTPWTDTGIDLRPGQEVIFSSTGQVRWGPGRRDGAEGEKNSPVNQGRPMPRRNAAALIGRIGPNGDPFFIGEDTQPVRVRGSGRLFLGINDDVLQDNSGSLRVTIAY